MRALGCGFAFLLVLALAAGGAFLWGRELLSPTGAAATTLEVRPGTSTAEVASELERRGLMRSAALFRLVLRFTGADRGINEGLYALSGRQDALALAAALERGGRPRTVRVVLPEGLRLPEIAARLEAAGLGPAGLFEAAFRETDVLPQARGRANLEGFLFPATYDFLVAAAPGEVARTLVQRFTRELTPGRLSGLERLDLSVYEWVTLASMVQAEAGEIAEMSAIAGVFLNRLDDGMPLQSDPTVAYGLGKRLPELDRSAGDFTRDTPYNSYTRRGLPPGPINNPGSAALASVLTARRTGDDGRRLLYFLHGLKGEFRANADYRAHLRDLERYR